MDQQTVAEFVKQHGITAEYTRIHARPDHASDWDRKAFHFVVTLFQNADSSFHPIDKFRLPHVTTLYSMGSGLIKYRKLRNDEKSPIMPSNEDMAINVLGSLKSDAECVENVVDLQDFMAELGYEVSQLRDAEETYLACKKTRRNLIEWLGSQRYSILIYEVESL